MLLFQNVRGALLLPLALLISGVALGGSITVTPTVSPTGSLFHYDYSITNDSGIDLAVLDIAVTPGAGTILNLTGPSGFVEAYDPILGLVSFLEDTLSFGSTPISGFAFDSPLPALPTTFTATLTDANFNVSTMTGSTSGSAVPEPNYLPVLAICGPLFWFLRRRFNQNPSRS